MDRKLKNWEIALMFGVLVAVVAAGWLGREQQELADSVVRFHVIANSDSEEDQALKLAVRDRVLAQAEGLYPEGATLEEARLALEGHLNLLAAAGREVVEERGYAWPSRPCVWARPARRWTRPWRPATSPRSRGRWSPATAGATS